MLEIGGVENARRKQHDTRPRDVFRREVLEHVAELQRIIGDGPDFGIGEDGGEKTFHHLPVFQHIGDAGGTTQVVFEHINFTVAVPHQVGAGDMAPDAARRIKADALFAKGRGGINDFPGDDAGLDDFLVVVNVVDEQVQRTDALLEAGVNAGPLLGGHDARKDVEGENFLHAGLLAIDVEGDAHLEQQALGGALAVEDFAGGKGGQRVEQPARTGTRAGGGGEHFVVESAHIVIVKAHNSGFGGCRQPHRQQGYVTL